MESPSPLSIPLKLLNRLIKVKVNDGVIDYMAQYVTAMVKVSPEDTEDLKPSTPAGRNQKSPQSSVAEDKPLPLLNDFIENISIRSRCTMATMLVALIYLDRLQKIIRWKHPTAGKPCSRHRVVFTAIMISHKIWNDSSMVGKHWAEVSNLFTSEEVLAMEREILILLRYDLELTVEEIWNAARPFMQRPFLAVNSNEIAEAEACVTASRLKYETLMYNQAMQSVSSVPPASSSLHEASLVHPYSSLHYSLLPASVPSLQAEQHRPTSTRSSPAPVDQSDTVFCSPAFQSSPLLVSPSPQAVSHPTTRANAGGVVSFSRTHTTRSLGGSTTRTTTRLTMKNVSHMTLSTKGTAHVYLGHPSMAPAARLKRKKYIASVQRFHLPTSMHALRPMHHHHAATAFSSSSPHHSSVSSHSTSSSSSVTTSIPSSPSCYSAGGSTTAQSPSLVWYAHHPQEQYVERRQLRHHHPFIPVPASTKA